MQFVKSFAGTMGLSCAISALVMVECYIEMVLRTSVWSLPSLILLPNTFFSAR